MGLRRNCNYIKLNIKVDDDNTYLSEWISPSSRMGFVKGKYFDVYLALVVMVLVGLVIGFFTIYKLTVFIFAKFIIKSKLKNE